MVSNRTVNSIQTALFTLVLLLAGAAVAQTLSQTPPSPNIPKNMIESGRFVVAGPVLDQGRIGGMAIINASSLEEATRVVNSDKTVQSGRLAAEIHPVMLADLSALHVEYPEKAK